MSKILLIEDDPSIGEHLQSFLKKQGLEVHWEQTVNGIHESLESKKRYDLVILDRLVENIDTKDLLGLMKKAWPMSAIFVISAISTPNERAEMINLGADEYMGKPFSSEEVLARLNSLLRRSGTQAIRYIKLGGLVIDQINRSVTCGEVTEQLPAKEFLLLKVLSQEAGRVWSRESLLDTVWGSSIEAETNVVEATITNLRRKLQHIKSDASIHNMRNAGYWIEA